MLTTNSDLPKINYKDRLNMSGWFAYGVAHFYERGKFNPICGLAGHHDLPMSRPVARTVYCSKCEELALSLLKDKYGKKGDKNDSYTCCVVCGGANDLKITDTMDGSFIMETETTCKKCGFKNYWAHGHYEFPNCSEDYDELERLRKDTK